jgi:small-conductance mechanosensitive channel
LILAIYTQGAFASILASFSVVGIVIGLSAQDILKNFFAGVWVLIERPFRIGDSIEVTGYTGTVEEIAFRTTQLRTEDGREVIVPNGTFMTSAVVNLTRFPTRRAAAWLVLPADEKAVTTDEVREALAQIDGVSPEPPPSVELRSVADGKAQYLVTFWAASRDAALAQAVRALRARFPQGDVRIG